MFIEFSFGNYRSIKKIQTLSLVSSPSVSKDKKIDKDNLINAGDGLTLLKSVGIYGANASGKSNVISALLSFLYFTEESFADEKSITKQFEPFLLDTTSKNKPIFFQVIFKIKKNVYRYGFEITKSIISSEWLFGPANKNEVFYFTRKENQIRVNNNNFPEGVGLEKGKTKETNLFLNVVDAFNGKISKSIKNYLNYKIIVSPGIQDESLGDNSIEMLGNNISKKLLLEFMNIADFGIIDLDITTLEEHHLPKNMPDSVKKNFLKEKNEVVLSARNVFDSRGKVVRKLYEPFDLFESEGTKKFFNYAGSILTALMNGKAIFIDEFDSRFHPLITKNLVKLFNSKMMNTKKAQLIFVTHDTNLLDSSIFRRDQIYFSEKNKRGETEIYSLLNIGGIRNDASYQKDYIKGKYGAIPFVGDFKF